MHQPDSQRRLRISRLFLFKRGGSAGPRLSGNRRVRRVDEARSRFPDHHRPNSYRLRPDDHRRIARSSAGRRSASSTACAGRSDQRRRRAVAAIPEQQTKWTAGKVKAACSPISTPLPINPFQRKDNDALDDSQHLTHWTDTFSIHPQVSRSLSQKFDFFKTKK